MITRLIAFLLDLAIGMQVVVWLIGLMAVLWVLGLIA